MAWRRRPKRHLPDGRESMLMTNHIDASRVKLKRAYEPPADEDRLRVLVDRLWPRGIRKADAALHAWMKDTAPSTELGKWFDHEPAKWSELRTRHTEEIRQHPEVLAELRALARQGTVTLVYSAHDEAHNDAVVLRSVVLVAARN
jgi:uncharacterized protein YeaO (DUF488 family)